MSTILIPEDIAESGKAYLCERGYTLKIGVPTDEETLKREIKLVDGLIVRNARYPKSVFEHAKSLKVIARHGTGTDNIDVEAAEKAGIWVVNGPLANINAVAEYVIAQIMALSCGVTASDEHTRRKDWTYRLQVQRHEIEGQTLGIIGFGNIGKLVAKKAMGLGMKIVAYDPRMGKQDFSGVHISDNMYDVIACADYLSLHVPSTKETRGMFNRELFAKMKPGSCFINAARGDLYIEKDLIDALQCGHLSGAALDVYHEEPLMDSPLLEMKQVILSQHNAGLSEESKEKMSLYAAMGVDQVLSGKIPDWPVNHPQMTK